jgi:hypothetical protein
MRTRKIRDYFHQQITKVDPEIEEWKQDTFGNNDTTTPQAQNYYNLVIGPLETSIQSNSYVDIYPIQLTIYNSDTRCVQDAFDQLYDKAIECRTAIICPYDYRAFPDLHFIGILPNSITPIEEITNDNALRMVVNFQISIGFKF